MLQQPKYSERNNTLVKHNVLLYHTDQDEEGKLYYKVGDERSFYTETHGFGHVKVEKEADYTLIEQMDDGWLQIAFQDNLDLYGGIDGKYQDLLDLLRDNKAINSLICNTIERGE
jgi:hypothetical protein